MARRHLTGVLLVGGSSRRFGSPKALARFNGKTFAEQAWGILGAACDERLAFGKAADELPLPFPVHDDGVELRAPLAGIVAGLRAARNDVCVFLPVDMPFATAELLRALGKACEQAAVPQTGPLPGAYARSALAVLERRLAAGELALRDALAELAAVTVELDPAQLVNVNAPEELAALSPG
jgi:molybdopterin-guanine dinucleotide biosynthesis protein A